MTIKSKFRGRCSFCNWWYNVGDEIGWTPGVKGARHLPCEWLLEERAKLVSEAVNGETLPTFFCAKPNETN